MRTTGKIGVMRYFPHYITPLSDIEKPCGFAEDEEIDKRYARIIANVRTTGDYPDTTCRANAEFLVLAWNCHDELVAALELARSYLGKSVADSGGLTPNPRSTHRAGEDFGGFMSQSSAHLINLINCVDRFTAGQVVYQGAAKDMENAIEALVPIVAKHKVGSRVELKNGKVEITKIKGYLNNKKDHIHLDYYGRKVLKDGTSLHKSERRLYSWDFPDDLKDPLVW